jgi:nitroreductase
VQLLYGESGYNVLGNDPEIVARRQRARMMNYEFFGAPVCAVITTDKAMHDVDIMCVGMFVNSFVLALTEQGLGCCLQVSVTGYPEVLKREFGLDDSQKILCGMAIGWARKESQVNAIVTARQDMEGCVRFLE